MSADHYTPSLRQVRLAYIDGQIGEGATVSEALFSRLGAQFDRWLDAALAAAWEEGWADHAAEHAWQRRDPDHPITRVNPYESEAVA